MPYIATPNAGWNAGARSLKTCVGDCQAEFSVPNSVAGVCIGLATTDSGADFREIQYGLLFQGTAGGPRVYVYESGVQKFSGGVYASDDRFCIRRTGSIVKYLKNGVVIYTSLVPSNGQPVMLDTSLYAAGDSV
jgi:hypothetical protein